MALIMDRPVVTRMALNPAQQWVHDPARVIFGETRPHYNGVYIDSSCQAAEPQPVTAIDATNGYARRLDRIAAIDHRLSWPVNLAPNWITRQWWSDTVAWVNVRTALRNLDSPHGQFEVPGNRTTGRILFRPQPDAITFHLHIYSHEMQHVADARYIAARVFGPWCVWLDFLSTLAAPLRMKNAATLDWILEGGDSGASAENRLNLYRDVADDAAKSFHGTTRGREPQLSYAGTSVDGTIVWVDCKLPELIRTAINPELADPHHFFTVPSARDYAGGSYTGLNWSALRPAPPAAIAIEQAAIDAYENRRAEQAIAEAKDDDSGPGANFWDL